MKYIIFILVLSGLAGCDRIAGSKQPADALDAEWKVFSTSEYSISYPETWEFDNSGGDGSAFFIIAGRDEPEDAFRENISLTVKDLSGFCNDLAVFTDMTLSQTKKEVKNAVFSEVIKLTGSDGETESVVFSGDYGDLRLQWKQYYKIAGSQAYILTFSAQKHKYTDYLKVADKVFNSFHLKGSAAAN